MLLVIETKVVIEAPDGTDPEGLAQDFSLGYYNACLAPFEGYAQVTVLEADVSLIRPATEDEERLYNE